MIKEGHDAAGEAAGCGLSPETMVTSFDSVDIQGSEDIASTSVEAVPSKAVLTRGEWWLSAAAFFLVGVSSLFAWNNVLYMLHYIADQFLDGWDAGNTLLGVFQVGNLASQFLMLLRGATKQLWLHLGLTLGALLFATSGPCVVYGSVTLRIAMLHIMCFLLGAGSGMMQGSGVSYSAIMPANQVSMYSTGQGFGSIFSIVFIGVLSFTALDLEYKDDVATMLYIVSGLTVATGVLTMVLIVLTFRQPAAKEALAAAKRNRSVVDVEAAGSRNAEKTMEAADAGKGKDESLLVVFKQAGVPVACIFLIFFVTCNLFPRVGPIQWQTQNPPKNYLVWLFGIFPFGDTLGRAICIFADRANWLKNIVMFPPKLLPCFSVLRLILYLPFFLSKHLVNNAVFNAFWFQVLEMLFVSFSHGWLSTLAYMYSFDSVPDVRVKRRVGPLCVLSLIFGIMSGLFFALVYR